MKEWGVELVQDEIINPKGEEKSLSVYNKKKFLKNLIDKCNLYVNDSIYSMDSFYPTIIDVDEKSKKLKLILVLLTIMFFLNMIIKWWIWYL